MSFVPMSLDALDDQSLATVLRLQLEELERLKSGRKGKQRAGEARPDFEIAADLYRAELASCTALAADRAMCRSIAQAVAQDADAIRAAEATEQQAVRDREAALQLAGCDGAVPVDSSRLEPAASGPEVDEVLLRRLEALYVTPRSTSGVSETVTESSSWAASRKPKAKTTATATKATAHTCTSCTDDYPAANMGRCPCSHEYCHGCLEKLFRTAVVDESLFPPRCCGQPIPADPAVLSARLMGEFRAKKAELEDPDRTYCHRPACSTFVPRPFVRDDVATCARCHHRTCVICKGAAHNGDCPRDAATQELLRVAAENGWQRCFACQRLVELDHGCNHMTCRCGAQFCYVCGQRWKTCPCDQWNEDRLLARANVIVNRGIPAARDVPAHADRIEEELRNLMQNHECTHANWRSRRGSHRCEECHDLMPSFAYECLQCRIIACRRCRYNRL